MAKRKVSNLLINPKFQKKYVFWMSSTGIILTCINATIIYFFTKENYEFLVEMLEMTEEARGQMYQELYQIIGLLGVSSIVFMIIVSIWGIILSHRVAGPLHKLKMSIDNIKNGETDTRVFFRKNDHFQDLAASFNDMMDELTKNKK
ncbi:MAG: HAMP domain-containing protein [Bdellovibrionales bacterium]|nr:HAMP domain-containing protein [Bdellovibrionales bacterium]